MDGGVSLPILKRLADKVEEEASSASLWEARGGLCAGAATAAHTFRVAMLHLERGKAKILAGARANMHFVVPLGVALAALPFAWLPSWILTILLAGIVGYPLWTRREVLLGKKTLDEVVDVKAIEEAARTAEQVRRELEAELMAQEAEEEKRKAAAKEKEAARQLAALKEASAKAAATVSPKGTSKKAKQRAAAREREEDEIDLSTFAKGKGVPAVAKAVVPAAVSPVKAAAPVAASTKPAKAPLTTAAVAAGGHYQDSDWTSAK